MKPDVREVGVETEGRQPGSARAPAWAEYIRGDYAHAWKQAAGSRRLEEYDGAFLRQLDARAEERILECGVGTGEPYAVAVSRMGARVVGIDIAPVLLRTCMEGEPGRLGVEVVEGDVVSLPFRDDCFDKVYCVSSFWCFAYRDRVLSEMVRVLKPRGTLIVDSLNVLHPSLLLQQFVNRYLSVMFRRHPKPPGYLVPWRMERTLRALRCDFQAKGFFVLAPYSLPLLGSRFCPVKRSRYFSFGLQDRNLLKYLGAKLVYTITKREDNGRAL